MYRLVGFALFVVVVWLFYGTNYGLVDVYVLTQSTEQSGGIVLWICHGAELEEVVGYLFQNSVRLRDPCRCHGDCS